MRAKRYAMFREPPCFVMLARRDARWREQCALARCYGAPRALALRRCCWRLCAARLLLRRAARVRQRYAAAYRRPIFAARQIVYQLNAPCRDRL